MLDGPCWEPSAAFCLRYVLSITRFALPYLLPYSKGSSHFLACSAAYNASNLYTSGQTLCPSSHNTSQAATLKH